MLTTSRNLYPFWLAGKKQEQETVLHAAMMPRPIKDWPYQQPTEQADAADKGKKETVNSKA